MKGFLTIAATFSSSFRQDRIAGSDDDADASPVQIIHEAVGQLIASKLDVDQGYVRAVFGDQTFCFGHGCGRSDNIGS